MKKTPNTTKTSSVFGECSGHDDRNVVVLYPHGALGNTEPLVEAIIRAIKELYQQSEDSWSCKYGSIVDNDAVMMHPFCWCEGEDCPWCRSENRLPNFHYKPLDFSVKWYKYIGRGMKYNKQLTIEQCADMLKDCVKNKTK